MAGIESTSSEFLIPNFSCRGAGTFKLPVGAHLRCQCVPALVALGYIGMPEDPAVSTSLPAAVFRPGTPVDRGRSQRARADGRSPLRVVPGQPAGPLPVPASPHDSEGAAWALAGTGRARSLPHWH